MKLSKILYLILYYFSRFVLCFFAIVSLVSLILLTVHVIRPYEPFVHYKKNGVYGFIEYMKGVPVHVSPYVPVPDSNFTWERYYADGSSEGGMRNSTFGDFFTSTPVSGSDRPLDTSRPMYSDTILYTFHGENLNIPDPSIRSATIDGIVFYLWPEKLGERMLLFLPILSRYLAWFVCGWLLFRLLRDIKKRLEFKRNSYLKVIGIGLAIVLVQLAMFQVSRTKPFTQVYSIRAASSIPHYRMPMDLHGQPDTPFNMDWMVIGCVILVMSGTYKWGRTLQVRNDISI